MPNRIEIELTSARPDGTWTWRAAGAREPKGVVEGSVLPPASKVGDTLRVEAEMDIDGITIQSVLPPKGARKEPERLEILGADRAFEPVTSTLVGRRDRDRDRGDRPRRDRGDRPPRDGDRRGPRPGGRDGAGAGPPGGATGGPPRERREPREPRERRERPARPPVPMLPERPKPKRLRPGRAHRKALLEAVPDEQRPVAELVLRGGIPAVREAIKEQNEQLKAEGKPPIKPDGMLAMAEELQPRVRLADWLDRAEAALADLDELDLRDLRSVVTAAADPSVAREESARDLAEKLRTGLAQRQDKEHEEWLSDIDAALGVGRVVRALRLSSRPPKAGVRFPTELGARLATAAGEALTADAAPDRWAAVLEAVAFSPVRGSVTPAGYPTNVTDELKAAVTAAAAQVPEIAKHFGIEPPPEGSRPPRSPRRPTGPKKKATGPKPIPAPPTLASAPSAEAPVEAAVDRPAEAAEAAVVEAELAEVEAAVVEAELAEVEAAVVEAELAEVEAAVVEAEVEAAVVDAELDELRAEALDDEAGALAAAELAEEAKAETAVAVVGAVEELEEIRAEAMADEADALAVIDAVDEAEAALADDEGAVADGTIETLQQLRAEAVAAVVADELTLEAIDEVEADIAAEASAAVDALEQVEVEALVDAMEDEAVIAVIDDARADG